MPTPIVRSLLGFCTLLFVLTLPAEISTQETGEPVVIGERFRIESQILNETRSLMIGTPRSYLSGEKRYPVLYVLDGEAHFEHTMPIAEFLAANDRMPEVLVVAVPNGADRTRDLTPSSQEEVELRSMPTHGGADNFVRFLSDELMPWVESRYRTRPYSILVGHSYGGLFAVHTLLTRPDLFDAYLAISPSLDWNNQALVAEAETFFEATPELFADLYMTIGNEGGAMLGGVRTLAGVLDEHAPALPPRSIAKTQPAFDFVEGK